MGSQESALEELWTLIRSIPRGQCTTYGGLGRALRNPASGYLVGRWMAQCPDDVPWWRVVAKDGRLPIHKRDPAAARVQQELLGDEGIAVANGTVDMDRYRWDP